jgi:primary-amine oxidase
VVKKGPQTFEAVVDVNGKKLVSWAEMKGVQPNSPDEEGDDLDAVKENPDVKAALKRRGITDFGTVSCTGNGFGYFGTAEEQGRWLFRLECFQRYGALEDGGVIEGLSIQWDGNEKKVLRVIDTGVVPLPRPEWNYDLASVGKLREVPTPITVQQPLGPSYRIEGQSVIWQKWNFHFRIDRRVGLVVSNVFYQDGDKLRSILYEGSLSEVFVPYMDPSEGWFAKTFLDLGELGSGFSSSLETGDDCPDNAAYFDQIS